MFSFVLNPKEFHEQMLRRTCNSISQQSGAWELCIWGVTDESLLESILKEYARIYGERIVMIEEPHIKLGTMHAQTKGSVIFPLEIGAILTSDALVHIEKTYIVESNLYDAYQLSCGTLDADGTPISTSSDRTKILWKRETLADIFESDPKIIYQNDEQLLRACSVTSDRIFIEPTPLYYTCA